MATAALQPPAVVHPYSCDFRVEYPSAQIATIIQQTLSTDAELQPLKANRTLTVEGSALVVHFDCSQVKLLRVCLRTLIDTMLLATETVRDCSPDA